MNSKHGFQVLIKSTNKRGKEVDQKVGPVYQARSAADHLVALYEKQGIRAWVVNA